MSTRVLPWRPLEKNVTYPVSLVDPRLEIQGSPTFASNLLTTTLPLVGPTSFSKYKFMEVNMLQRKRNLDAKIPEIRKTLEMVQFLQSEAEEGDEEKEIETMYELNDTLYATAKIKPTGKVCLWLGVRYLSLTYTLSFFFVFVKKKEAAKVNLLSLSLLMGCCLGQRDARVPRRRGR